MPARVITDPILNSPFAEPQRHHRFDDEGITEEIAEGRRKSAYFVPIPKPRSKGASRQTDWTEDRVTENEFVNQIRARVAFWRDQGRPHITATTRRLIEYWTDPVREKRMIWCQVEAAETAIFLTEAARKTNDTWIENELAKANAAQNDGLPRLAFKMATGTGKTVVMGMLIAWHVLNKQANPQDARFGDSFLIVTPGITIRDRLRVLFPSDPSNYYRERDLVPPEFVERLGHAKIVITNFHAFLPRERGDASKLTKSLLTGPAGATGAAPSPFRESPGEVVRRVCRELGNKKNLIVMNDEAHHCYDRRATEVDDNGEALKGDERREAEKREEEARVWITGLKAVKEKLGLRAVYDLSATPFFLRGSGYSEGTLFPWVVSDFSLIDAIEAGLVKIPRVPVADDSMQPGGPTYRDLWLMIRDHLPKKTAADGGPREPILPEKLEGALRSLYSNYEQVYQRWDANEDAKAAGAMPPVFIVVCNNTAVSKLVYDYIAGWEKQIGDKTFVQAGRLDIFRNDDRQGGWLARSNTILIDSRELESGEGLSQEYKRVAAREIEDFKTELRRRFPGRDVGDLEDADILREVMNTVGKRGKLGEHVKCVVSVSMLTEGWDANTVTHILGVRAFGTQLLCEQVVGRALRRMSYAVDDQGFFTEEYAEVYGVPFSFIPCAGGSADPKPGPMPTHVRALPDRAPCEVTFPRLVGYRYELPTERLNAEFTDASTLDLGSDRIPTKTETAGIVGGTCFHSYEDLRAARDQQIAFYLARVVSERYFRDPDGNSRPWLFPQLLRITRHWMAECVTLKDGAFLGMLLIDQIASDAALRIFGAIREASGGEAVLKPTLRSFDPVLSTRTVDFDTVKPTWRTRPDKCHLSHAVCDTGSWEQRVAQSLEEMDEVVAYVKNHHQPGFVVPYRLDGEDRSYLPDFIARVDDGHGAADLLNLIIEVTGEKERDKEHKVAAAKDLWVPAVNGCGAHGRWAFLEIRDPQETRTVIRAFLREHGAKASPAGSKR